LCGRKFTRENTPELRETMLAGRPATQCPVSWAAWTDAQSRTHLQLAARIARADSLRARLEQLPPLTSMRACHTRSGHSPPSARQGDAASPPSACLGEAQWLGELRQLSRRKLPERTRTSRTSLRGSCNSVRLPPMQRHLAWEHSDAARRRGRGTQSQVVVLVYDDPRLVASTSGGRMPPAVQRRISETRIHVVAVPAPAQDPTTDVLFTTTRALRGVNRWVGHTVVAHSWCTLT